jgi:uncharacterized protein YhjY with autotransporter beta-barrel domain
MNIQEASSIGTALGTRAPFFTRRATGWIVAVALLGHAAPLAAQTITVTTTADSGAGSLRAAIASATPGENIVFADSLAGQTITLTSGALAINSSVTISAAAAPGLTISGNNASQIFVVSGGTVAINNLNLTNGQTAGLDGGSPDQSSGGGGGGGAGLGGAVEVIAGSVTLTSDNLTSNRAAGGNGGSINGNYPNVNAGAGGGAAGGAAGAGSTTGNGGNGGNGGAFSGGGGGGGTYGAFNSPTAGNGGTGGFGAGGGGGGGSPFGGGGSTGGSGGTLGGNGGNGYASESGGGGGGAGLGGAIFVNTGATLSLVDTSLSGNSVTAGQGGSAYSSGTAGTALGSGIFLSGGNTAIALAPGAHEVISDDIAELPSSHSSISVDGFGTLVLSGSNSYTGGTTDNSSTVQFGQVVSMPASGTVAIAAGATLAINVGGTGEFTTATSGAGSIGGILSGIGGQGAPVILNVTSVLGIDTTNAGGPVTYGGTVANDIGLAKLGTNTLILTTANTYSGGTTVQAGTLAAGNANALGTSDVTVSNGATLTTSDGGTGMAIAIGGNYRQQAGGTLLLNIYGANNYDSLNLAGSGTATVTGTLELNLVGGFKPGSGQDYTVITSSHPVVGQFTSVITNLPSVGATADYSDNVTVLFQLPFATLPGLALTPNQQSVAAYLDANDQTAHGAGFGNLIAALNNLSANPSALAGAFNQLSPLNFANFASSTAINNTSFLQGQFDNYLANHRGADGTFVSSAGNFDYSGMTVSTLDGGSTLSGIYSHLLAWSPPPSTGLLSDTPALDLAGTDMKDVKNIAPSAAQNSWNFFVAGNAILAQDFSDNSVGENHLDATTGAVQLGADYRITSHFLIGALFGYGHTDASLDNIGSTASVDTYLPALYASYANGGWYANALGGYGFDEYTQDRNVSLPAFSGTAHSTPSGDQIVGDLDGGYDFHYRQWTLGPTLGAYYTHVNIDSYTETGLPGADLSVNRDATDSLRSLLGGRVSYATQSDGMTFTPHLSANWQHEFMDQSRGITSQFSDVGAGTFAVQTAHPSRDSAFVDLGLDLQIDQTWTVYTDYSVNAGQSNYFGQSIQAGVKIGF